MNKNDLPKTREELFFLAKTSLKIERYEEMMFIMNKLCTLNFELNKEERLILSLAYKNVLGSKRMILKTINSLLLQEETEETRKNKDLQGGNIDVLKSYKLKVVNELKDLCYEAISIIDIYILKSSKSKESFSFFYKMKGDIYRYLSEILNEIELQKVKDESINYYELAVETSKDFQPSNPIKLSIALNFSIFYYEIMNSPENASKLAKKAFDSAISDIDNVTDENYKETTQILQLLKEKLTFWSSENEIKDEGEEEISDQD
eukprot:gene5085-8685_t